jgi:hypothetical protein
MSSMGQPTKDWIVWSQQHCFSQAESGKGTPTIETLHLLSERFRKSIGYCEEKGISQRAHQPATRTAHAEASA